MTGEQRLAGAAGPFRLLVWQVTQTAGFESAWVQVEGLRVRAVGHAAGQLPVPYWLSYILETDTRAVTARLEVTAMVLGAEHRLDLQRDRQGWTADGQRRPDLANALDCDLARSPVTSTMPVIRHRLQHLPGTRQFVMAFVEVPTLRVTPMSQSYTHLRLAPDGATVRYSSGTFSADFLVDDQGLIIDRPPATHRIEPATALISPQRQATSPEAHT